jgi:chromosomal replication initiation ATPase DnaA
MLKISQEAQLQDVVESIEDEIGMGLLDIRKKRRSKDFVFARQLFVRLYMDYTNFSTVEIGRFMGFDHTSVLHLYKKSMEDDLELAYSRASQRLKNRLTSSFSTS